MYLRQMIFCFILLAEILVVGVESRTEIGATSSKNKGTKFAVSLCSNQVSILVNSTNCEFGFALSVVESATASVEC